MKKFKILLFIFLLPITYIVHYLTGSAHGVSAYLNKEKRLEQLIANNNQISNEIEYYRKKIKLLKREKPDIDLIDEKALEILGLTDKVSITVNLKNQ